MIVHTIPKEWNDNQPCVVNLISKEANLVFYRFVYPLMYCTDSTKRVLKGYFTQIETMLFIIRRYHSSKIDIFLRKNLNIDRLCAYKFSVLSNFYVKF